MIVRPLLEYLKLKSAAEQLAERPLLGRTPSRGRQTGGAGAHRRRGGHQDRPLRVDRRLSEDSRRPAGRRQDRIHRDTITVKERISQIADALEARARSPSSSSSPSSPRAAKSWSRFWPFWKWSSWIDSPGSTCQLRNYQDILPVIEDLKSIIESLLFVAEEPLSPSASKSWWDRWTARRSMRR